MAGIYHFVLRDEASALPSLTTGAEDPAPVVIASIWSMWAVSITFLALRLYCRGVRTRALWWDDYILLAGCLTLTASNGLTTALMHRGFGVTPAFQPRNHTLSISTDVVNKFSLGLTKTSFAVTLLRLCSGWQRRFVWFLIVSMNLVLAVNAVTTWMAACDRVGIDNYEAVLPGVCWDTMDAVIMAMVSNSMFKSPPAKQKRKEK
jgi:hypothetical protein